MVSSCCKYLARPEPMQQMYAGMLHDGLTVHVRHHQILFNDAHAEH